MFTSRPTLPEWDWQIGSDLADEYETLNRVLYESNNEPPTTETFFSNPYNYELLEDMPF
jgi:hypothetical protein